VVDLAEHVMEAGHHSLRWNGMDSESRSVSGGLYLIRIRTGWFEAIKKVLLLR